MLHDSARLGAMLLPGMGFTSASWVAERTMNGVPWIVSAGSNHVGTSVVCTAHVIVPSGAAAHGAAPTSATTAARSPVRIRMTVLPSGSVGADALGSRPDHRGLQHQAATAELSEL